MNWIGPTIVGEIRRIRAQLKKTILQFRLGFVWVAAGGLDARVYPNYECYLDHQRTKYDAFREKSIRSHDRRFYDALSERLYALHDSLERRSVLCLAARQGTEVRAFIGSGAFAVGIDLNPGKNNRYVVTGDFHDLQFANGSVGAVYTNSLDHAFDLDRILGEVARVLAPDGLLIVEVGRGNEEGNGRGFYESLSWPTVDALLSKILPHGFRLERRSPFDEPWPGEQLVLRLVEPGARPGLQATSWPASRAAADPR